MPTDEDSGLFCEHYRYDTIKDVEWCAKNHPGCIGKLCKDYKQEYTDEMSEPLGRGVDE
jgi:hypothetical protein